MKSIFTIAFLATIVFVNTGCKKDEPTNTAPTATEAPLTLHIDTEFNGDVIEEGGEYTAGTTKFRLDALAFYINSVEIIKSDSTVIRLPDNQAFYVKLTEGSGGGGHSHKTQHGDHSYAEISLGNVPKGSYKGIRFSIGHPMMTGHNGSGGTVGKVQPTDFADDHALSAKTPSMWWAWASGYIFFRADGVVDTNNNGVIDSTGTTSLADRSMTVHLGTSDMIQTITSFENRAFTVGDGNNELALHFDFSGFFNDINLREEYVTHSLGNGAALARRYRNNLNSVFYVPVLTAKQ